MTWAAIGGATIATIGGSIAAGNRQSSQIASTEGLTREQIAAQERQKEAVAIALQPFIEAGTGALEQQQNILGLNGPEAQQQFLSMLQNSPQYTGAVAQGENALLQNASATGGLRGGNLQAALAQFRPQLLNQMISNQLSGLGNLTALGQRSAEQTGYIAPTQGQSSRDQIISRFMNNPFGGF